MPLVVSAERVAAVAAFSAAAGMPTGRELVRHSPTLRPPLPLPRPRSPPAPPATATPSARTPVTSAPPVLPHRRKPRQQPGEADGHGAMYRPCGGRGRGLPECAAGGLTGEGWLCSWGGGGGRGRVAQPPPPAAAGVGGKGGGVGASVQVKGCGNGSLVGKVPLRVSWRAPAGRRLRGRAGRGGAGRDASAPGGDGASPGPAENALACDGGWGQSNADLRSSSGAPPPRGGWSPGRGGGRAAPASSCGRRDSDGRRGSGDRGDDAQRSSHGHGGGDGGGGGSDRLCGPGRCALRMGGRALTAHHQLVEVGSSTRRYSSFFCATSSRSVVLPTVLSVLLLLFTEDKVFQHALTGNEPGRECRARESGPRPFFLPHDSSSPRDPPPRAGTRWPPSCDPGGVLPRRSTTGQRRKGAGRCGPRSAVLLSSRQPAATACRGSPATCARSSVRSAETKVTTTRTATRMMARVARTSGCPRSWPPCRRRPAPPHCRHPLTLPLPRQRHLSPPARGRRPLPPARRGCGGRCAPPAAAAPVGGGGARAAAAKACGGRRHRHVGVGGGGGNTWHGRGPDERDLALAIRLHSRLPAACRARRAACRPPCGRHALRAENLRRCAAVTAGGRQNRGCPAATRCPRSPQRAPRPAGHRPLPRLWPPPPHLPSQPIWRQWGGWPRRH